MIEEGYIFDLSFVFYDVEDFEKLRLLKYYSERLVIVFGLIFILFGFLIRVVKNFRVCVDCYTVIKFIFKIIYREIFVRDFVRFYLFKNGICLCGDFW